MSAARAGASPPLEAPASVVAALRETSIVFALAHGRGVFGEPIGRARLTAAAVVVAGVGGVEDGSSAARAPARPRRSRFGAPIMLRCNKSFRLHADHMCRSVPSVAAHPPGRRRRRAHRDRGRAAATSNRLWSLEEIVGLMDAGEQPKKRGPYKTRNAENSN